LQLADVRSMQSEVCNQYNHALRRKIRQLTPVPVLPSVLLIHLSSVRIDCGPQPSRQDKPEECLI
jgi:hypothetical protein